MGLDFRDLVSKRVNLVPRAFPFFKGKALGTRLQTGMENDIFWSEIGSGFGELGGTPPPKITRSTPFRGQGQGVNHVGWFISVIIHEDKVYPWTRWYTRRGFAPGACPWSMLQEQNPSCVSAFIPTDFEIVIRNFTRPFWNITQGIYAEYHVQIMLLFVYTTTGKRFVISTCKYFELSIPLL